jgi:hypothetical protein
MTGDQAQKEILCEVYHQSYIWWLSAQRYSPQIWYYSQPVKKVTKNTFQTICEGNVLILYVACIQEIHNLKLFHCMQYLMYKDHSQSTACTNGDRCTRFQVVTVVQLMTHIYWDVALCCWTSSSQYFAGSLYLHFQNSSLNAESTSKYCMCNSLCSFIAADNSIFFTVRHSFVIF